MMQACFHLLDNPSFLKQLRKELDQAIPSPSVIPPCKDLEALPLLVRLQKH